jgi:hypothetical protein
MSLGTNPENFANLFLLFLAALPAALLLVWFGMLVQRLLRIESGVFSITFLALLFIGPFLGASLYLDTVGTVVKAQVLTRTEQIHYREEGDWQHEYHITVQYTIADQPPLTASFNPSPTTFDTLHKGDTIDVRAVTIGGWFNYMRLANQTTFTWLPWRWIGIGLAVISVGWLLWQLSKRTWWGWVLTGLILLALIVSPVVGKMLDWQRSQDLSLTPLRIIGTVQAVQRVTWLDPLPSRSSSGDEWDTGIDVPQPYDIVVVRFTPQGHDQPVLGVDVVDADRPVVKVDTSVELAYAQSDPRTVRLPSAQRSHYWKNPISWFGTQLGALAVIALLFGGFVWLVNRGQKWLSARINRPLPR